MRKNIAVVVVLLLGAVPLMYCQAADGKLEASPSSALVLADGD